MYTPRHFAMPDDRLRRALAQARVGHLVTVHSDGPAATLLPVAFVPQPDALGSFWLHVARINEQCSKPTLAESLLILPGPDAYVSPRWLPSADQTGKVVPTWDYVVVHAYGDLIVHDDAGWVRGAVDRLTDRYEPPGFTDTLPDSFRDAQLRAIVGLELRITRVEAKEKLSQNKTPADVAGIVAGLDAAGERATAAAVREVAVPAASRRAELIARVAREHRPD